MTIRHVLTINPPSFEFSVDGGGFLALKLEYPLEHAACHFEAFPTDVKIIGAHIWSQRGTVAYPGTCDGDVTWAVYDQLYAELAGVPANEVCQPIGLDYLGRLLFRPGADLENRMPPLDLDTAIPYEVGQRLGAFFEVGGAPSYDFHIFTGLRVASSTGFVPLPNVVYRDLVNRSAPAASPSPNYSYRSQIGPIKRGGTEVRITNQSLTHGLQVAHQSVAVRSGSSGYNATATPVEVTTGGATGLNLGPFVSAPSDWRPLVTSPGDVLLVHSEVTGPQSYKTGCQGSSAWVAGSTGHDSASFSGTVQSGWSHAVSMVEVR